MAALGFNGGGGFLRRLWPWKGRGIGLDAKVESASLPDEPDPEYEAFIRACGGRYSRDLLDEGSALGAAFKIGGQCAKRALGRVEKNGPDAGTAAVGVMIAIFVLEIERRVLSRSATSSTHPPLEHRAMWVIGGESFVLRRMEDQYPHLIRRDDVIKSLRGVMSSMLHDVGHLHPDLFSWLAAMDAGSASDNMNAYIRTLREGSAPYLDRLDELAMF